MNGCANGVQRFLTSEDGPTSTEYAIMLALIVLVALAGIVGIGKAVDSTFTTMDNSLPSGVAS